MHVRSMKITIRIPTVSKGLTKSKVWYTHQKLFSRRTFKITIGGSELSVFFFFLFLLFVFIAVWFEIWVDTVTHGETIDSQVLSIQLYWCYYISLVKMSGYIFNVNVKRFLSPPPMHYVGNLERLHGKGKTFSCLSHDHVMALHIVQEGVSMLDVFPLSR